MTLVTLHQSSDCSDKEPFLHIHKCRSYQLVLNNMNVVKMEPDSDSEIHQHGAEREKDAAEELSSVKCEGQDLYDTGVESYLEPVGSFGNDGLNDVDEEQLLRPISFVAVNDAMEEETWNGIKIKEELKDEVSIKEFEECLDGQQHMSQQEDTDNYMEAGHAGDICPETLDHSQMKRLKCDVRLKEFSEDDNLKQHSLTDTCGKPYRCDVCEKEFSQSANLKRHYRLHSGEKPYRCHICNKFFAQSDTPKAHSGFHNEEKPYTCDLCNKKSTVNVNLKRHYRIHTEVKLHKCDVCNEAFSLSSALRIHSLSHLGVKTHKCNICFREFTRNEILKKHYITHTGEKPYKCQICGKDFSQSANLQRHERTHSGEKPFKCDLCEKTFSRSEHLKSHSLTHTGL